MQYINQKKAVLVVALAIVLSACQNQQVQTKAIAGAFDAASNYQQKQIDRYAPASVQSYENIVYHPELNLKLDIHQPKNIQTLGDRPTVIWIHGGGWVSGTKQNAQGYFKLLAAQGYNVVSVEYQLAPQAIYPAQLLQINQAIDFLLKHTAQYHIDASQIYLAGDSAGANLASHYATFVANSDYARQEKITPTLHISQLKGLILHCGIYDMEQFVKTAPKEMKLVEWGIYRLVEAYTSREKTDHDFLKRISPPLNLNSNYPPVLISGGDQDFLTETQAKPFVNVLKAQKIEVKEVFYPNSNEKLGHEYQFMMEKKASQDTFKKTVEFLKEHSPE